MYTFVRSINRGFKVVFILRFDIKYVFFSLCLFCLSLGKAQQLEVRDATQPPWTPERLIEDIFLGNGVEIIDIRFRGVPAAVGHFINGQNSLGIDEGIIMSTGNAAIAASPNNSDVTSGETTNDLYSDSDLQSLLIDDANPIKDIVSYEITFRPQSDRLVFEYLFASEEYPSFICGIYNDVFGFFISGPNPSGGDYQSVNIATIPNTNIPISINSVHPGVVGNDNCNPTFEQFYNDNFGSAELTYNAYLDQFFASAAVIPCETYTIKMVLGDVVDTRYDTSVFLKARSFRSESIRASFGTSTYAKTVEEGCAPANLLIELSEPAQTDYFIEYEWGGSASEEMDFLVADSVFTIAAGDSVFETQFIALNDNFQEGTENALLQIKIGECIISTSEIVIQDPEDLSLSMFPDTTICFGDSLRYKLITAKQDSVFTFTTSVSVAIPDEQQGVYVSAAVSGIPANFVTGDALHSVCVDIDHPRSSDLRLYLIAPNDQIIELSSDNGGSNAYQSTCFYSLATNKINADTSLLTFIGDFLPESSFELLNDRAIPINSVWQLCAYDAVAGQTGMINSFEIRFRNPSKRKVDWLANDSLLCEDCTTVALKPDSTTVYSILLQNQHACSNSERFKVTVLGGEPKQLFCVPYADSILFQWTPFRVDEEAMVQINGGAWSVPNRQNGSHLVDGLTEGDTVQFSLTIVNDCGVDTIRAQCVAQACNYPLFEVDSIYSPKCFDATDGLIKIVALDNRSYEYQLNGVVQSNGRYDRLQGIPYTLIVSDSTGCTVVEQLELINPPPLESEFSILEDVTCFGVDNGDVSIQVANQQGNIEVLWDDGGTGLMRYDIRGGSYTVQITDEMGCQDSLRIALSNPAPVEIELEVTSLVCGVPNTASIVGMAKGGVGAYTYQWSNGSNEPSIFNLNDGQYFLLVRDSLGCEVRDTTEIISNAALSIELEEQRSVCADRNNGVLAINPLGGTTPYRIDWDFGASSSRVTNLALGQYCVTVTDAAGCEEEQCYQIEQAPSIFKEAKAIQPTCDGDGFGRIALDLDPLQGPYSVLWTSSSLYENDGEGIKKLVEGAYSVFIEDGKGCQYNQQFEIGALDTLVVKASVVPISCQGIANGRIELDIVSSNGQVETSFDEGAWDQQQVFSSLDTGLYQLDIRDEANCILQLDSLLVKEPLPLEIQLGDDRTIRRGEEVSIFPKIQNANGDISYRWIYSDPNIPICSSCIVFRIVPESTVAVKLLALDENGCAAEALVNIFIDDRFTIEVPTAFTPNGDNLHDLLLVHGPSLVDVLSFQVFDRAHNLLFEANDFKCNDINVGWDGFIQGQLARPESYIWRVAATIDGVTIKNFSGVTKLLPR